MPEPLAAGDKGRAASDAYRCAEGRWVVRAVVARWSWYEDCLPGVVAGQALEWDGERWTPDMDGALTVVRPACTPGE